MCAFLSYNLQNDGGGGHKQPGIILGELHAFCSSPVFWLFPCHTAKEYVSFWLFPCPSAWRRLRWFHRYTWKHSQPQPSESELGPLCSPCIIGRHYNVDNALQCKTHKKHPGNPCIWREWCFLHANLHLPPTKEQRAVYMGLDWVSTNLPSNSL